MTDKTDIQKQRLDIQCKGEWLPNSNTIIEVEHLNKGEIKLNEDTKYIAFYADIPHNKIDEVVEDIKIWYGNKKSYLIGLEYAEAREHYHFVIDFTEKEYAAYVRRVLKDKYHLNGRRSKKGHTGGFGKVSKIRNIDAMCSYTLKDLNYHTNFSKERIDKLIKASYPKPENEGIEFMKECMKYIKENLSYLPATNTSCEVIDDCPREVAILIIKFMKERNKCLTASTIRRFTMRYLTYESPNYTNDALFSLLFPHGI